MSSDKFSDHSGHTARSRNRRELLLSGAALPIACSVAASANDRPRDRLLTPFDFGAISGADCTLPLQRFFAEAANRAAFIPKGVFRSRETIRLDPGANYHVTGAGYDINIALGATLLFTGTGNGLELTGGGDDQLCLLADFGVAGTSEGQDGLRFERVPGLRMERLHVVNFGGSGVTLVRCYNARVTDTLSTHNGRHGIHVDTVGNNILLDHCICNSNARLHVGAGIAATGGTGLENLGLIMLACDTEGNGATPLVSATTPSGHGMFIRHSCGVEILGGYAEANRTTNINADRSVSGLSLKGFYAQDGDVVLDAVNGLDVDGCTIAQYDPSRPSRLMVSGGVNAGLQRIGSNRTMGTARLAYDAEAGARRTTYGLNSPPALGTRSPGDEHHNLDGGPGRVTSFKIPAGGGIADARPQGFVPGTVPDAGDRSVVWQSGNLPAVLFFATPLTADREVTFHGPGHDGASLRVVREHACTGPGALRVRHAAGAKLIEPGTFADFIVASTAFKLSASGAL